MPKLLTFGDSWPFGSELREQEKPFGRLLAEMADVPYQNFARYSTSIPHLLLQIHTAREYMGDAIRGSVALFFLTSPNRDLIWSNKYPKELHLNPNHPDDKDILYYSQIHTPELSKFRVNSTLLALMKICEHHGIIDRYVWGWDTIGLWPEVDRERFYDHGVSTAFEMFDDLPTQDGLWQYCNNKNNLYISPNSGHPNQLGHRRIADRLYPWLEPCISGLK